jgi:hypothetical protein
VRSPSAGATGVIIETERLRMRAHRGDDLADLSGFGARSDRQTCTTNHVGMA